MSAKLPSPDSPSRSARDVSQRPGQLPTMLDARVRLPVDAVRDRVARHLAQRPRHVLGRHADAGQVDGRAAVQPRRVQLAAGHQRRDRARGDSHSRVPGRTGHTASSPLSGSRIMPLAKDEAAALGLPGRTLMVGRRSTRPSTKPRRV